MFVKEKWKIGLTLFIVIILITLSWIAFQNEKSISEGRLHVHKPIVFPKDTPNLKNHALVFFGYVGCPTVCTPRMEEIAEIYKDFVQESKTDELSVLFINLKGTMSTEEADTYAKSFHPEFMGVTYDRQELLTTLRMFQAYYSHNLFDSEEMEHSQFLYFVHKDTNKGFYLNNIYIDIPYNKKMVVNDLVKDLE